uniref:Uncharacterized protein n=1 Tax=Anopheles atroparvus TaxID=41427 RepID=A0A182IT12_ANOAO
MLAVRSPPSAVAVALLRGTATGPSSTSFRITKSSRLPSTPAPAPPAPPPLSLAQPSTSATPPSPPIPLTSSPPSVPLVVVVREPLLLSYDSGSGECDSALSGVYGSKRWCWCAGQRRVRVEVVRVNAVDDDIVRQHHPTRDERFPVLDWLVLDNVTTVRADGGQGVGTGRFTLAVAGLSGARLAAVQRAHANIQIAIGVEHADTDDGWTAIVAGECRRRFRCQQAQPNVGRSVLLELAQVPPEALLDADGTNGAWLGSAVGNRQDGAARAATSTATAGRVARGARRRRKRYINFGSGTGITTATTMTDYNIGLSPVLPSLISLRAAGLTKIRSHQAGQRVAMYEHGCSGSSSYGITNLNNTFRVTAEVEITKHKVWHWSVSSVFMKSAARQDNVERDEGRPTLGDMVEELPEPQVQQLGGLRSSIRAFEDCQYLHSTAIIGQLAAIMTRGRRNSRLTELYT